jgi:hypothetical protein
MNSMNNTLTGLASSLLLNVGLTRIAEKLDPMHSQSGNAITFVQSSEACAPCGACDCNFATETGL